MGRDGLVVELLYQEIKPLQIEPLHLPMPDDERPIRDSVTVVFSSE